MLTITAVCGDITEQKVDAVVNPANTAMCGGGGADGAIHRAGGPAILRDCVKRFPDGLAVGDAGWTTAGELPARWVIHTVGPNYNTGVSDRSLLESCYRRALEVADELGARTIAFPLIGTGARRWPRRDAIATAIETLATVNTRVDEVRLVSNDSEAYEQVLRQLAVWTPIRILQGVRVLHQRGYHRLRILPGDAPSGMYWRLVITRSDNLIDDAAFNPDVAIQYTTGAFTEFAGGEVTVVTAPEMVADLILSELPDVAPTYDDPGYVAWYAGLLSLVEQRRCLPIAFGEYFDPGNGWEIGGVRYPRPLGPPTGTAVESTPM